MKKNEVRHGNLVIYGGHQTTIDEKEIIHFIRFPDKYEPIPLTEEWLLKFGFKRFPWGLVAGNLLFKDNLKCTELTFEVGNGFRVEIKYVHQLQNLYFCLCGKELTLKP